MGTPPHSNRSAQTASSDGEPAANSSVLPSWARSALAATPHNFVPLHFAVPHGETDYSHKVSPDLRDCGLHIKTWGSPR